MTDVYPFSPFNQTEAEPWRGPKRFRSRKAKGDVMASSRTHEDVLILSSLDPEVVSIATPTEAIPMPEPFGSHLPSIELRMLDGSVRFLDVPSGDTVDDKIASAHRTMVAQAAKEAGVDWRFVGDGDVADPQRLSNARLAYRARSIHVPAGDRIRMLQFLEETQGASLIEAARLASTNVDGVEVVLNLVMDNMVEFDLDEALVPETVVRRSMFSYQSSSAGRAA